MYPNAPDWYGKSVSSVVVPSVSSNASLPRNFAERSGGAAAAVIADASRIPAARPAPTGLRPLRNASGVRMRMRLLLRRVDDRLRTRVLEGEVVENVVLPDVRREDHDKLGELLADVLERVRDHRRDVDDVRPVHAEDLVS